MKIKAFTLIETILYLALFNVIFFAVITWAIALGQSNKIAEYKNALEKNSILVTEHLSDTFKKGVTVDPVNSIFDNADGKVRVTFTSGFLEYSRVGNVFTVTDGTTSYGLTDKFVNVTNFTVSPIIIPPSEIVGARISMTISGVKFPNLTKTLVSYYAFR